MDTPEDILFRQFASTYVDARQAFAQQIGMSLTRLQMLLLLASRGELSHAALQQRLALDGATITRQVKQFEAEGVVSRRLDPQDNRYTLVALTPSGQQIVAGLSAAHQEFVTRLLDGISLEEQTAMLRVFERLRTNIHSIQEGNQEHEGA